MFPYGTLIYPVRFVEVAKIGVYCTERDQIL